MQTLQEYFEAQKRVRKISVSPVLHLISRCSFIAVKYSLKIRSSFRFSLQYFRFHFLLKISPNRHLQPAAAKFLQKQASRTWREFF